MSQGPSRATQRFRRLMRISKSTQMPFFTIVKILTQPKAIGSTSARSIGQKLNFVRVRTARLAKIAKTELTLL